MSVLFAATLPIIILFCGLSLDIGMLQLKKLQMQSAADAAALGAELEWERATGNWVVQGQDDAALNGFTNGTNNATVSIVNPATTGTYAGYAGTIQATVTQKVSTIFMGTLNGGTVTLNATSVALVPECGYFMNKSLTASNFVVSDAGPTFKCPVYINQGMNVQSNANATGVAFGVVGTSSQSSNVGGVSPAPVYNSPKQTDPLAAIASPSFSACTSTSTSISNTTTTISPGTYCKGLNISSAQVTLNPGLYIITGGGTWSNATVTGTGITLFFTTGGGASYGQFVASSVTLDLSAPTSNANGGIPGILVFGDRNWVKTSQYDFQFSGLSIEGDGIWYTTATGLSFSSCNIGAPDYLGMVTDTLYAYGTSSTMLLGNFSMVQGGNPTRSQSVLVQ